MSLRCWLLWGSLLFVVYLRVCSTFKEEPDFMGQVMPVICKSTNNITRRIWYLACVEYLMEYGLEKDGPECFKAVHTGDWTEAFAVLCGEAQANKHHYLMQCFSDKINEHVMYDARDVAKILQVLR
ncbi:uncharacterized protein LOC135366140 [Ornithodoros turicata]|uniref:uncharacterized protein LOC135366140 n=1 Tax=Ornithodoros turicata TaxID=34597 RepID=UPI003139FF22